MTFNVQALIRDIKVAYKRLSSSNEHSSSITSKKPNPLSSKSSAKAKELREDGNWHFKKKKFNDALFYYSKSIAYALDGSEELGQAYDNRSAVLFKLEKYASCLLDINRALKNHCSDLLTKKLLVRKKLCLDLLLKSSAGGSGDADLGIIDEDATNPPIDREPSWRADVFSQFGNPLLPNVSPKIKLKYDEKWGRHFVATADIKPGETLFIENYFVTAMCPDDDGRYKYCDFCNSTCDSLIPCPLCTKVMFCSIECRQKAYDFYHRTECKLSFHFAYESVSEAVAIRMFLTGTEQGKTLENLMNTLSIRDIFTENFDFSGKPTGSDYMTVLRLTHGAFSESRLKPLIKYAVKFVTLLRKNAFFECVPSERLKEAEVFAIALLLNNRMPRYMNGLHNTGSKSRENLQKGSGICPLQYLFNHSCYPNVGTYRKKRENIIFATQQIKKDEQLFVAYSNEFLATPKSDRIKCLNFECTCEACLNNWPTAFELRNSPMTMAMNFEDCLEYSDTREAGRILSSAIHVVVPLLDDNSLLDLRVHEIVWILSEVISLCGQVMAPTSFALIDARKCFLKFIEYYYDELERDPTQDRNLLKFPLGNYRADDEVWTNILIGRTEPTEMFFSQAVKTIFDALLRFQFYMNKSRFIRKK